MKTLFHFSAWTLVLLWICCLSLSAQPVQNGYAAGTCYSDFNSQPSNPDGYVVVLMDVRQANLQTLDQNWSPPMWHGPGSSPWKRSNLGEVFGLCFDPTGNIYVSATIVYGNSTPGGPGGSGAIYQLDGTSGAITTFTTLPNAGNVGLGNIAWDAANNQMFATNFEDGKIYRISSAGVVLSTYDPFAADGGASGLAPYGELIWGIGVYNNTVYFGRWNENTNNPSAITDNQVWSVALTGAGEFTGSLNGAGDYAGNENLEITTPAFTSNYSNPVSDIAFSGAGRMLIAERTVSINSGLFSHWWPAHQSRVLEYEDPGGGWASTGNTFNLGNYNGGLGNSAGGVDYAYGSYNQADGMIEDCDDAMWGSGDALHFGSPYTDYIYGWQWLPASGGNVTNSVLVDADGVTNSSADKTEIGDIEIYKNCDQSHDCPDIDITVTPIVSPDGECCYDLTFNSFGANSVASITANILTANTTFSGVLGPTGWNVTNTGTKATWDSSKCIPEGRATGLQFCVQTQASAPQQIEIIYLCKDGTECRDTIEIDCEPDDPNPCVVINDEEIACVEEGPNGWIYDYSFTVTNYSPFTPPHNAENVLAYSITPGVTISPANTPLSPTLGYGATSGTLNYTVSGPGAQPGDQVCIVVQLHGAKLKYDYQWCCPPDTLCFILPDCRDCCDSVDIVIDDNTGKQKGNTAASISSSVSVTPGPIMKMQANIMSVSRSRIWCPNASGVYTLVANPSTIAGVITSGSVNPAMPVAAGFNPATSEVVWGTVYSGVNMSGGSVNLNLSFPGTNLGWRCRDTLDICVRYTFTDTAWVTCDTVVYYKIPRCGRVDIVSDNPNDKPVSYLPATEGGGISIGEPLYSAVVDGPDLTLDMSDEIQGRLAVAHWWQDAVVGVDKIRLRKMYLTPEPGIDITDLGLEGGEVRGEISERTASIDIDLREGETNSYDVEFDNPTGADFFAVRVYFDYVDVDDEEVVLESKEYVVYGDLTGDGPSDLSIREVEQSKPTLYKLLIDAQGQHSAGWSSPSCFRFTTPEGVEIIASGPMQNPISTDFHVLRPIDRTNALLMPLPASTDVRGTVVAQGEPLALWLVLEGGADAVDLEWEALNDEGNAIAHGMLELSATSTVRDGDDAVPGAAIYLLDAWPNPSQEIVNTRFNLYRSETVTVTVYDATGKEVRRLIDNQHLNAGWHEYNVDLGNAAEGVYYIRLKTERGVQTKSIVKQN